MMDLNALSCECLKNANLRASNGGKISTDTRKMLKHTATEVVEAAEAYSVWCRDKENQLENKEHFSSELADIVCCCMIIAAKENINLEQEILDCMEKNKKRADGTGDKL